MSDWRRSQHGSILAFLSVKLDIINIRTKITDIIID